MQQYCTKLIRMSVFLLLFNVNSKNWCQTLQLTTSDRELCHNVLIESPQYDPLNLAAEFYTLLEDLGFEPRVGPKVQLDQGDSRTRVQFEYSVTDAYRCGAFGIRDYRVLIFVDSKGMQKLIAHSVEAGNSRLVVCPGDFVRNIQRAFSEFEMATEPADSEESSRGEISFFVSDELKRDHRIAIVSDPESSCNQNYDRLVRDFIEIELAQSFSIVDRVMFEEILDEQKKSLAGFISEETLVEVGNSIGAEALLRTEIRCFDGEIFCSMKLVDAKTTEIIANVLCSFEELGNALDRLRKSAQ